MVATVVLPKTNQSRKNIKYFLTVKVLTSATTSLSSTKTSGEISLIEVEAGAGTVVVVAVVMIVEAGVEVAVVAVVTAKKRSLRTTEERGSNRRLRKQVVPRLISLTEISQMKRNSP